MSGLSDNLIPSPWRDISGASAEAVTGLTGSSQAIRELRLEVERAGRCDAKVLITGESGVGKEVVARAIHACSLRRRFPMMAINCAGLPDSLLETTLFGHERGSYTGAYRDRKGLLASLHLGTLFMDEVCEMTPRMQAMMLRFLETGETQRVGADKPTAPVNVRIITATNRDVQKCVDAGNFREDLYFRLNVVGIVVPPLRQRPEDIPALLELFLSEYGAQHGIATPKLADAARKRLLNHPWPGNVRELRNAVESAMVRADDGVICVKDLPPQFRQRPPEPAPGQPAAARSAVHARFERVTFGQESFWSAVYEPFMARDITRDELRAIVRLGLERTAGDYVKLLELLRLPADDYKRFLRFLSTFDCHVTFRDFRPVPARASLDSDEVRPGPEWTKTSQWA